MHIHFHRHTSAKKEDGQEISICHRLATGKVLGAYYRMSEQQQWTVIPSGYLDEVTTAKTGEEVMALLRNAHKQKGKE